MSEGLLNWIDVTVLLNERRDEVAELIAHEPCETEKHRLEGALRELNWLIEQVQEKWGAWAGGLRES